MLKRFVLIMAAIIVLLSPMKSLCENLASKSIDELLRLQADIDLELASREYGEATLYGFGTYEIGVDIEPGSYTLIVIKQEEDWECEMALFDSYESMVAISTAIIPQKSPLLLLTEMNVHDSVRLRLREGQILMFGHGTYGLKKLH